MPRTELPSHEATILARLFGAGGAALSPAAAEELLALTFGPADKERMHALAAKAREGTLTPAERAEVEAYSRIGSLLGILHSKARRVLKGSGGRTGKARTR